MRALKVSLTDFQFNLIERMTGAAYGSSRSEVARYMITSYIMEHGDQIAAQIEKYDEWRTGVREKK